MKKSDNINELSIALSKFIGKVTDAKVDAKNPHFKNDYATLESVLAVSRSLLSACDLSIAQLPNVGADGKYYLTTILSHKSGQWLQSDCPLLVDKTNMQALGSAISYARRYALAAILSITQTDDDANEASLNVIDKKTNNELPQPIAKPIEKYRVPDAVREKIWLELTVNKKMSQSDAIIFLNETTKKKLSSEWNEADVERINKKLFK